MNDVLQSVDLDAEIKQVFVDFRIRSDKLIPSAVTSSMGIQPSRSFAKDEEYIGKSRDPATGIIQPTLRHRPWGIWAIDTKGLPSKVVNEHISYLINLLEPRHEQLKRYLENRDEYTISFYIWWEPIDGHGSYEIASDILGKLPLFCHYMEFGFVCT